MAKANLGIQRVHSIEVCVREAEPWVDYLTSGFGFQLVAASTGEQVEQTGTRRRLLRCRDIGIVLLERVHGGSAAGRYLERHPEGICRVNFLVRDLQGAEEVLLERHATPTDFVRSQAVGDGEWRELSIATPLGDVEYGFIEYTDRSALTMPGMEPAGAFDPDHNPAGLVGIDHLTANMRTLMPTIAWYEHVMGFRRQWNVQFHTEDFKPGLGTGLKSVVMADEESGVRIASNEPLRPRYDQSQVQVYVDLNKGPGINHLAWEVTDLIQTVDHARSQGVEFLPTPREYYGSLQGRITTQGIGSISQPFGDLESRGILLDGDKNGYLLQIFCKDQAAQFKRPDAGPLLLEFVQRCGSTGFGEGNFRALFEAMSRG